MQLLFSLFTTFCYDLACCVIYPGTITPNLQLQDVKRGSVFSANVLTKQQ